MAFFSLVGVTFCQMGVVFTVLGVDFITEAWLPSNGRVFNVVGVALSEALLSMGGRGFIEGVASSKG